MAKSNNLLLQNLSGHIGKLLVIKQYGNKTVVSKYPDMSKRKLSQDQVKINQRMKMANEEAQRVMADEALKAAAQVRLDVTSNKLYTALIKDYFKTAT
jgi:hypothetical protein